MRISGCVISLLLMLASVLIMGCTRDSDEKEKPISKFVIIDSDMTESFDDGVAFMMLLGTEGIQVKGITTETTNVWAQEALAYGIRLGELCGGEDVVYVAGAQRPFRSGRFDTLNQEIDASPGENAWWRGAVYYDEVSDWREFYVDMYGRQPQFQPADIDATDFIYRQVMSSPGEITILATGECTNIAKALTEHPEIAVNAKEIIYMGGAVNCPGNTTTYAEMNFLYDPEAAAICLRAPFRKQTLVSLDVCNTVSMDYSTFMTIYKSLHSEDIKEIVRRNYPYPEFEMDPQYKQLVWDLISAAIVIDPGIVTNYEDLPLDVDDDPASSTYGKSYVSKDSSCQTVRVPLQIDQKRFWDIVVSGMSKH